MKQTTPSNDPGDLDSDYTDAQHLASNRAKDYTHQITILKQPN